MAVSNGKLDFLINQSTESKKIHFEELDHLVENSRWLTTLVLAEIGGIAAYRQLMEAKSLSFPFTLIIVFLALTIVCFMLAVVYARNTKKKIANQINESIAEAQDADIDINIAPVKGDEIINKITTCTIQKIADYPSETRVLELIGIILFILCSIGTTLVLFFNESLKLVGF